MRLTLLKVKLRRSWLANQISTATHLNLKKGHESVTQHIVRTWSPLYKDLREVKTIFCKSLNLRSDPVGDPDASRLEPVQQPHQRHERSQAIPGNELAGLEKAQHDRFPREVDSEIENSV